MSEPGDDKNLKLRRGRLREVIAEVLPWRSRPRTEEQRARENLEMADRIIAAIYKAGYRITP